MRLLLVLSTAVLFAACGTDTVECGPANCAGCCSATGQCVDGTANDSCGTAGLSCNACSAMQTCEAKRCEAVVVDAGNPIVAPEETWTWAGFPESACGNGQPTGIGVNITSRSNDVLIYLMGGGACWSSVTCGLGAASNIDTGYTELMFANEGALMGGPFQRAPANNPFKDMSFVFVPYCTGDVHSGDKVTTYPALGAQIPERTVHHRGAHNMNVFLDRIRDTFPSAQRVFVSGSSAGAYGAQFNFPAVKAAFPNAEVHAYADCGQMVNPSGTLLNDWVASWNMQAPADCVGCTTDFTKFPAWLHTTYPQSRFGLLAFTEDQTLRTFFGYNGANFKTQTLNLLPTAYDGKANARYFVVEGSSHVMLTNFFGQQGPGTVSLLDWSTGFVNGDATWTNQKP